MSGLLESTVGGAAPAVAWTPLADVTESDDAFHIESELPGVNSKDIDVEANGQELVATGEIKEKEHKEDEGGAGDVADPAGAEGDVFECAPTFLEFGGSTFAECTDASNGSFRAVRETTIRSRQQVSTLGLGTTVSSVIRPCPCWSAGRPDC
jgi:hypothetical protein